MGAHGRLIAGAALDVYEREPHVHPDLRSLENVVPRRHIGSASGKSAWAMADLAVRNVIEVLADGRRSRPSLNGCLAFFCPAAGSFI